MGRSYIHAHEPQSAPVSNETRAMLMDSSELALHIGGPEGKGVAPAEPHEGNETSNGEGLHHSGQDVGNLDHSGVVQTETWDGHHENERTVDDHVGSVSGICQRRLRSDS